MSNLLTVFRKKLGQI